MRIAVVAGEASGDILGAGLIRALRARHPDIEFEGIGGSLMIAEGFHSLVPMERLSVMGLVEVLGRLRELLGIRRRLRQRWLAEPPDAFIGIDAPDFNLNLEQSLRAAAIPTVHYVSPSVWAWREKRVRKIARAVDLMLCLLPFEARFYDQAGVDARFVGHTLADELPLIPERREALRDLGLEEGPTRVALLPGSRGGEVERLAPLFIETARRCLYHRPGLEFLLPAASDSRYRQLEPLVKDSGLPIRLIEGRSRACMLAADAVLLASGTAALEAMLLKRPMVVSYRVAPLTYAILSRMVKVPYVSLPNLLAGEMLITELLQHEATPQKLERALLAQLEPSRQAALYDRFTELHRQLKRNASEQSAEAVLALIESRAGKG